MQQQATEILTQVFSEVLANLAFMFTDDESPDSAPDDPWLEVTIHYHGPRSAALCLRCSRGFSILMAANLLGVEQETDDPAPQADDAIKEFMNVLCGQLITTMHGNDDVFDLSIPDIIELPQEPDWNKETEALVTTVSVEGHRIQLVYAPSEADHACD